MERDEEKEEGRDLGVRWNKKIENKWKSKRKVRIRRIEVMDVKERIVKKVFKLMKRIGWKIGEILIKSIRDKIEIEIIWGFRIMEIIESEDLGRRIGKKLINGNKVEIGIGNILEKMVEEKLIEKMIRREKEKNLEDKVVNERISMVVIEENLKIEEKRRKENKEIRIKMKFKIEESEGKSGLIKVLIIKGDGKRIGVKIFNRKIKK